MPIDFRMPVLVVDHFAQVTTTVGKLLKRIGFELIEPANSGGAALSMLNNQRIGLVLADWRLEPIGGRRLLDHVRATKMIANLPYIVMSSDVDAQTHALAKRAGATAFLPKPFEARELSAVIRAIGSA